MHKQKLFVIIAAGLGVIGVLLPWFSCSGWGSGGSSNGFSYWPGYAALASCGAAIGLLFKDPDKNAAITPDVKKIVLGGGAGAVLFPLIFVLLNIGNGGSFLGVSCGIGLGPWITMIGGIGVLVVLFSMKADGTFEMPTSDSIKADIKEAKEAEMPTVKDNKDTGAKSDKTADESSKSDSTESEKEDKKDGESA